MPEYGWHPSADKTLRENDGLCHAAVRKWPVLHGVYEYEDLIQEARLVLWKAWRGFKPELGYKFSTYAVSAINRRMGQLKQRAEAPIDRMQRNSRTMDDLFWYYESDSRPGPDDAVLAEAMLEWVKHVLPPDELRVILALVAGVRPSELARELGVTRMTILNREGRARSRLRNYVWTPN